MGEDRDRDYGLQPPACHSHQDLSEHIQSPKAEERRSNEPEVTRDRKPLQSDLLGRGGMAGVCTYIPTHPEEEPSFSVITWSAPALVHSYTQHITPTSSWSERSPFGRAPDGPKVRADAAPLNCGGPYCFKYDVAVERPSVADLEDAGCRTNLRILECLALTAARHE